ncbi:hypothetical protein CC1G_08489 [Coprinopsis cinerea okayama7|uniref:Uncharacterized protein n=1 Tax=Coprinopsis cinerea (strain Okayama-7 / 130 / ATCC MYA-4618 / FGSC 9003) TaxID=240176 RepID=A8NM46_COPC7|nr:hypothetical protein CC1G_08489 [Coprinopsis cinerea okayama7\|eukprot:XP_001834844.2 hypothetical protein CC1G_08489 [Coprinopsis cinerea okayama7\
MTAEAVSGFLKSRIRTRSFAKLSLVTRRRHSISSVYTFNVGQDFVEQARDYGQDLVLRMVNWGWMLAVGESTSLLLALCSRAISEGTEVLHSSLAICLRDPFSNPGASKGPNAPQCQQRAHSFAALSGSPTDVLSVLAQPVPARPATCTCTTGRETFNPRDGAFPLQLSGRYLSELVCACVHPVFRDRFLKLKYEHLGVTVSDKRTKRIWARIGQTPSIANVVKQVRLQPWLVQPWTPSPQSRTEVALTHVAAFFDPHYTKKQADHRLQKRLSKDIQRVQTMLFALSSVQSYQLEWDGKQEYHPQLFSAFLVPVLSHWRMHLRRLTLYLPFPFYGALAQIRLPELEYISVCFDTGRLDSNAVNVTLDAWLVFLHNLKDTLRALSIRSTAPSEGLDLGRLFRYMGTFPRLRSLSLNIPFDGGHLPTPIPFSRFLAKHSETLEHLALRTARPAMRETPTKPDSQNWIQSIMNSVQAPLRRLEALDIALRPLRAPLDPLRAFLRLHSTTIRALKLTDRILTPDQIQHSIIAPLTITSAASNAHSIGLKRLDVSVYVLSPYLLRMLASNIPQLNTLELRFPECNRNPGLFHSELRDSDVVMTQWALKRFIMPAGPNRLWIRSLGPVLEECIPAIESVEELRE